METRTSEERFRLHNRLAEDIVGHAYKRCLSIRKRIARGGLTSYSIRGMDDLAKIHILRKDELIGLQAENPPFGGFLGAPESDVSWIFISPGSIFNPVIINDEARERSVAVAFYNCRFRKGDKVLNT